MSGPANLHTVGLRQGAGYVKARISTTGDIWPNQSWWVIQNIRIYVYYFKLNFKNLNYYCYYYDYGYIIITIFIIIIIIISFIIIIIIFIIIIIIIITIITIIIIIFIIIILIISNSFFSVFGNIMCSYLVIIFTDPLTIWSSSDSSSVNFSLFNVLLIFQWSNQKQHAMNL